KYMVRSTSFRPLHPSTTGAYMTQRAKTIPRLSRARHGPPALGERERDPVGSLAARDAADATPQRARRRVGPPRLDPIRALAARRAAARGPVRLAALRPGPAELLRPRRLVREPATEPGGRRVARAHGDRQVLAAEAPAVAGRHPVGRVILGRRAVKPRAL